MSLLKESKHLKITLEEIEVGTKNFQLCIGKGGFGMVYKGELFVSGKLTTVAVKRLSEQFGQGLKEFLTEIQLLTGQTHPNLISLLGYCDEGKEKMIVYEYAERGSLDQYLRRNSGTTNYTLTWLENLRICIGAARGLDHLHNHVGEHQTVIHRDIKSSNILIDENWVAKISDLGLSKLSLAGLNRSTVISHACGTPGYCEPEYIITGIVKKESDVYSFGIVLFEVLCGRLCNFRDDDGFLLAGPLVKDYYEKNKLGEIVDPGLKEQMSPDSMNKFSTIAYKCLHDDRGQRPSMDLVVKELEESLEIQLSSYAPDASYASEDTRKSRVEIEADRVFKESTIASSETPVITSLKENQLHDISTEVAYRSNVELQPFDTPMQVKAKASKQVESKSKQVEAKSKSSNTINDALAVFEARNISIDSLMEVTEDSLEMNQEVMKVILDAKKDVWKNEQLFELVEEYFKNNQQTLDFHDALDRCLKSVKDIPMMIRVALHHFEEKRYVKTIQNLKNLKAAGDPFTNDIFNIFENVFRQLKVLLEKLQTKKLKMEKKLKYNHTRRKVCNVIFVVMFAAALIFVVVAAAMSAPGGAIAIPAAATLPLAITGIWTNSFFRNYVNAMKAEKEIIGSMNIGVLVGANDLNNTRVLVEKVVIGIEKLIKMGEFALYAIEGDEEVVVVKRGMEELKKKVDSFVNNVEMLAMQADDYRRQCLRTRTLVLQKIANSKYNS